MISSKFFGILSIFLLLFATQSTNVSVPPVRFKSDTPIVALTNLHNYDDILLILTKKSIILANSSQNSGVYYDKMDLFGAEAEYYLLFDDYTTNRVYLHVSRDDSMVIVCTNFSVECYCLTIINGRKFGYRGKLRLFDQQRYHTLSIVSDKNRSFNVSSNNTNEDIVVSRDNVGSRDNTSDDYNLFYAYTTTCEWGGKMNKNRKNARNCSKIRRANLHISIDNGSVSSTNAAEFDETDYLPFKKDMDSASQRIENVYSFSYNNFAYFLRNHGDQLNLTTDKSDHVIKLTRVCLGDLRNKNFRSLISIPLNIVEFTGTNTNKNFKNSPSNEYYRATSAVFDEISSILTVFAEFRSKNSSKFSRKIAQFNVTVFETEFDRQFIDCFTNESADYIAVLKEGPELCVDKRMIKEGRYACNYDEKLPAKVNLCSPSDCVLDALYYLESYRFFDGNLLGKIDDFGDFPVKSNESVEKFEFIDQRLLYLVTSGGRFFLVHLDERKNAHFLYSTQLNASSPYYSTNLRNPNEILIVNGTEIFQLNLTCDLFETCQQISQAISHPKFASCGWCLVERADSSDGKSSASFGFSTDKTDCLEKRGFFTQDSCPPTIDCFYPSVLNRENYTNFTLTGNFTESGIPLKLYTGRIEICGTTCDLVTYNDSAIVCQIGPFPKSIPDTADCSISVKIDMPTDDPHLTSNVLTFRPRCRHILELYSTMPKPSTKMSETGNWWIYAGFGGVVTSLGLVTLVLVFSPRISSHIRKWKCSGSRVFYRRIPQPHSNISHVVNTYVYSPGRPDFLYDEPNNYSTPYEDFSTLVPPPIVIPWDRITVQDSIGAGHFGQVHKGVYTNPTDNTARPVALKSLRIGATSRNVKQFIQEGIMMENFKHENVLTLIGITFNELKYPMIVTPFMAHGDLLTYIRDENNNITVRELLNFAVQIAEGLKYLHKLKFIHRDLAARNCMLDESLRVKVADFGLSRDVYESGSYLSLNPTGDIPIRWLPLESLERQEYTPKSDIWSYGVTLWELMTRGRQPYAGLLGFELLDFLKSGRRLDSPYLCPDEIYELMRICWHLNPEDRPDSQEICIRLPIIIRMLETESPDYYNMTASTVAESTTISGESGDRSFSRTTDTTVSGYLRPESGPQE